MYEGMVSFANQPYFCRVLERTEHLGAARIGRRSDLPTGLTRHRKELEYSELTPSPAPPTAY